MQNLTSTSYYQQSMMMMLQKQPELPEEEQLKCPRCDSANTKFCYYNNYNLSQPRHFCKNCRRYWTKGGSLRNIPIGGGTRKNNKRSGSSSSTNTNKILAASEQKKPDDQRGTESGSSGSGSGSRLEEEKSVTGQEMDSTRMLYGLPVGVDPIGGGSLSSLGMSGSTYENGSGWYPGISLGLRRSDDTWSDVAIKN